jgi:hypothetical protein
MAQNPADHHVKAAIRATRLTTQITIPISNNHAINFSSEWKKYPLIRLKIFSAEMFDLVAFVMCDEF